MHIEEKYNIPKIIIEMILTIIIFIAVLTTEILLIALFAAKEADKQMERMKEDNNVNDRWSI